MICSEMMLTHEERKSILKGARFIGNVSSGNPGPTVVFFGGIHGNEPAGVLALEEVFREIETGKAPLESGRLVGIKGNLQALDREQRFLEHDLNRIWSSGRLRAALEKPEAKRSPEEKELGELFQILHTILREYDPPFYFIDLHTTSSQTLPFITVNDSIINRKFSELFPVPVILGIEEYLEGPLLSYVNELGYLALGFESGQHQDPEAVRNAADFIWLTLNYAGLIPGSEAFREHLGRLRQAAANDHHFYEVYYRHRLAQPHSFTMKEGFRSFQPLKKGTLLAEEEGAPIQMEENGILFMPLYQKLGEEGFFLIRRTPAWALKLSARLRKWNVHRGLTWLPGVSWANGEEDRLLVNQHVARFLSKPLFHLLGYRSKQKDRTHLILSNREHKARNEEYEGTFWFSHD
jgi:succinylglutamate desuccinylase